MTVAHYDPEVGDVVESTYNYKIAKVVEVNNQFGWFVVEYFDDGSRRRHTMGTAGTSGFRLFRKDELADFYLKCQRLGITDYWSE